MKQTLICVVSSDYECWSESGRGLLEGVMKPPQIVPILTRAEKIAFATRAFSDRPVETRNHKNSIVVSPKEFEEDDFAIQFYDVELAAPSDAEAVVAKAVAFDEDGDEDE